jgi:hypothetical protein
LSIISALVVGQSNLTEKQLESLASYIKVARGEMRYREAATSRSDRPVTIGSYYRTVQQGRNQIRMSMATVLIAIAMGLVKMEDVRKLFELIGKGDAAVSEEDEERLGAVLQALLEKIVM